jgi:hypothetical protein
LQEDKIRASCQCNLRPLKYKICLIITFREDEFKTLECWF